MRSLHLPAELADDVASAEKLARCMPKDKIYGIHSTRLYRNQSKWDYEFGIPSPDGVHAALLELAGAAGMSEADDANKCLASRIGRGSAAISKVGEDGVARYAVAATPTFVINGQGPRPGSRPSSSG